MTKKTTIQDIADALGLSRNTVSKAINNAPGLAVYTRDRILQKAVEMGYKHFPYVQSLYQPAERSPAAGNRAAASPCAEIALLTSSCFSGSRFASLMLDRLYRELTQMNYRLNIYHVSREELAAMRVPFGFERERVSAVICIEMFDLAYDRMLCALGLPLLFVDGPACAEGEGLPADQLLMENSAELTWLLSEMLRRGLRRIGFLGD